MTKAALFRLAQESAGETLLHASYTLAEREYRDLRLTLAVMLSDLRERLGLPRTEVRNG